MNTVQREHLARDLFRLQPVEYKESPYWKVVVDETHPMWGVPVFALQCSIAKWEFITRNIPILAKEIERSFRILDGRGTSCALCKTHPHCINCAVAVVTGIPMCRETPWAVYNRTVLELSTTSSRLEELAREEVRFLESLQTETEPETGPAPATTVLDWLENLPVGSQVRIGNEFHLIADGRKGIELVNLRTGGTAWVDELENDEDEVLLDPTQHEVLRLGPGSSQATVRTATKDLFLACHTAFEDFVRRTIL